MEERAEARNLCPQPPSRPAQRVGFTQPRLPGSVPDSAAQRAEPRPPSVMWGQSSRSEHETRRGREAAPHVRQVGAGVHVYFQEAGAQGFWECAGQVGVIPRPAWRGSSRGEEPQGWGLFPLLQVGRTEVVPSCLHPMFSKVFTLDHYFEEVQKLRFEVYEGHGPGSHSCQEDDFLGGMEYTLGQVGPIALGGQERARGAERCLGWSCDLV